MKIYKLSVFFFFLCLAFSSQAQSFKKLYKVGDGHSYIMKNGDNTPDNQVSIYITDLEDKAMSVEYFIRSKNSFAPLNFWQQFKISRRDKGAIKVERGYVIDDFNPKPQIMEDRHLKGTDLGVKTSDFLFSSFKEINQYLVNKEEVTVPAGKVKANRYKISNNGQTVEFWIAQDQSPLTMVKLISKGKSATQNYELQLKSLLKNVKAKIDPSQAVPLTKKMKETLDLKFKKP